MMVPTCSTSKENGGFYMEIQLWREFLEPYAMAVDEIVLKFRHFMNEYRQHGLYSPIEQVEGRVKRISSLLEKTQRKQIPMEEIEEQIEDIAGIRIICQFVEDIDRVVEMIRGRQDMKVKQEKDYIRHAKGSGYRSYHMIVYYTVQTMKGPKKLKAEIQIRTLAMNFWAVIEHSLQYKYQGNMPEHVRQKLLKAAEAIVVLDHEMSTVREEIMDAQNSYSVKSDTIADILNTIQNLYQFANKREVEKIQDEFYNLYQQDDLEKLIRFHKQLDIIAEGYRAQSLN
jgi:putative GTP pyrophosphokinase